MFYKNPRRRKKMKELCVSKKMVTSITTKRHNDKI
jgi:hypothetical protein